ncbi:hypothetical protein [Crateriforma conspicua]|uniref:hypothetical protein n=1 Tax=Crateriforma conspicua TaxID=2527996 RepID=UPI00118C116E|nr:hypothetical protein [Crateriforma conspicua]QDV61204.1 hypothetical protein Mal65_03270 [Crateriforma conspicua]
MDKFYVQSGSFRCVVQADDSRKAALWAVHQVMGQILPIDGDEPTGSESADGNEASKPVAVLGGRVKVSRRGYDRDDAGEMPTMDVVADWNQMVTTLDRLQRMMYRAA